MASRQKVQVDITATDKTKAAFNSLNRSLTKTQKVTQNLGKTLAGLGAGTALTGLIANSQRTIQAIDNLSVRINASATALSELKVAAELTGVSFESFGTAMQRMQTRIGQALAGSQPLVKAFNDIGLSAENLANLSADAAFGQVVDSLQAITNQAERQNAAFRILDQEGVRLLQTFGEIARAREIARATGSVVSQEEIAASDRLNTSIATLKAEFESLGQTLIVVLEPALSGIFTVIGGGINVLEVFAKLIGTVGVGVYTLVSSFKALSAENPTEAFNTLFRVLEDGNVLLDRIWESTDTAAQGMQTFSNAIPTADKFGDFLQNLRDQNEVLRQQAAGNYEIAASIKAVQAAEKAAGVGRHGLDPNQVASVQELSRAQQGFKETIAANEKALRRQEQFADQVAATMTSAFADAVIESEKLSDVFDALLKDLAQMVIRMAVLQPLAQGISGGIAPFLPKFASGTNYAPGGLAVVGERGAEVVNLPRGSQVIPNHKLGTGGGTTVNVINAPPDTQVERQQQSDGSEIVNVILAEVARDVANGGQVSRSIQGTFGSRQQAVMR